MQNFNQYHNVRQISEFLIERNINADVYCETVLRLAKAKKLDEQHLLEAWHDIFGKPVQTAARAAAGLGSLGAAGARAAGNAVGNAAQRGMNAGIAGANAVGGAAQRGANAIGNTAMSGANAVGGAMQRGASAVGNYANDKLNAAGRASNQAFDALGNAVDSGKNKVMGAANAVGNAAMSGANAVKSGVNAVGAQMQTGADQQSAAQVMSRVNGIYTALSQMGYKNPDAWKNQTLGAIEKAMVQWQKFHSQGQNPRDLLAKRNAGRQQP